ncbi:hypothetical protein I8F73_03050 [Enterococcus faecalis]|nr:hypothetical protein [Enterococcus faecalis]
MKEGDKKNIFIKTESKNKNKNERGRKLKKWILSATLIILLRAFADVRGNRTKWFLLVGA